MFLASPHPVPLDGDSAVSDLKPAIFRKVKKVKYLSGVVALYAAHTNAQIDAEIVGKGGFLTETILSLTGGRHV